jgi:SAM-dependent methyltransferase
MQRETEKATRGYGLFENQLAKHRARRANALIPSSHREGRIPDIGSGEQPYFLMNTVFSKKFGIEQIDTPGVPDTGDIVLVNQDVQRESTLPFEFEDDFFDVVTMLAVLEHIEPPGIPDLMREVYRVLKAGGVFILTTPTSWTDGLLRLLAKLRLVSQVEIADHKDVYTHNKVRDILREARFPEKNISLGYFEAFMNIWARASK